MGEQRKDKQTTKWKPSRRRWPCLSMTRKKQLTVPNKLKPTVRSLKTNSTTLKKNSVKPTNPWKRPKSKLPTLNKTSKLLTVVSPLLKRNSTEHKKDSASPSPSSKKLKRLPTRAKEAARSLKTAPSRTKKDSNSKKSNLRKLKPEPNSPKRPLSSSRRTLTNLKMPFMPRKENSEPLAKTWMPLSKESAIYKLNQP